MTDINESDTLMENIDLPGGATMITDEMIE
jgi:hypothetical protein